MNTFKARFLTIFVLGCLLATLLPSPVQALGSSIIYVDQHATGLHNGTSWKNACIDLQSALGRATSGTDIWVAQGIYKPGLGRDREATFQLKGGVRIFGGFVGNETVLAQRKPLKNVTTLSGDIGIEGVSADNSFHVITGNDSGYARLDGFTVSGGYANGEFSGGGGLIFWAPANTRLALSNMIFSNNKARAAGGGVFVWGSGGSMTLERVTFLNNRVTGEISSGGGMHSNGNVTMEYVTFRNNSAVHIGGGLFNIGTMTISNSTFEGNSTSEAENGGGGGLTNYDDGNLHGILTVTNSTFYGNSGGTHGGGIHNHGVVTVSYSTFSQNDAQAGSGIWGWNLNLSNNILANNTSGPDCTNYGTYSGTDHNLIEVNDTGEHACGSPFLTADPNLGPLQDNGAFTDTLALLSGSPAIDAGDDVACPDRDQRAVIRPQGSHCDLGAYEALPVGMEPGTYDDTDANWVYSEFTATTTTGPYLGTFHYSTVVGGYAEFLFTGSQITLLYSKYSNRGDLEVYVDGALVDTIDQYNATRVWQASWTSGDLGAGGHTVRLVHAGPDGSTVDVDAITILP
ncbi:MAG: choice-of-anchor Q domain-containing protein [Chloroflexota bacterium]|nr:choice-of-anchor Q domain-containing protein [Anaerolineales bacterium]